MVGLGGEQPRLAAVAGLEPVDAGLADLCERIADVCQAAVDPLEIVAALEFDGMGDQAARERYGFADVFALAEEAYRRTARQPADPRESPDPYRAGVLRPITHGLLYGLPAICFPAATGLLGGPNALIVLVVSSLVSWSLGQGLAFLGFLRLGRSGVAEARAVLRGGLIAGMVIVLIAMAATGFPLGAHLSTVAFGAGQGAYMLGACVLMVLGVEWLLAVVLAPGVIAGAVFLILGKPPVLTYPVWAALALIPLLALTFAWLRTSKPALPKRSELVDALPAAGFGLIAAALLAFPIASGVYTGNANTGALLATLPLSLSMGVAEWTLYRYRRRTRTLLRTVGEPARFARGARFALAGALSWYLAGAAVLIGIVAAIAFGTGLLRPQPAMVSEVAAYILLGGAMYLSLLLQTFGSRLAPLAGCAAALAFEFGLVRWGAVGQVVAGGALLLGLGWHTTVLVGGVVRHA
jgi:hypothetical protein